jgi:hypothetical protein
MSKSANDNETEESLSDQTRAVKKWLAFTKGKKSLGFHKLQSTLNPSLSANSHGYALCIDKVVGWKPPTALQSFSRTNHESEISLQLSLSLFNLQSLAFFGSTWRSSSVCISSEDLYSGKTIDFPCDDIVYLLSRIRDSSCIGIIELIALNFNRKRGIAVSEFGYSN